MPLIPLNRGTVGRVRYDGSSRVGTVEIPATRAWAPGPARCRSPKGPLPRRPRPARLLPRPTRRQAGSSRPPSVEPRPVVDRDERRTAPASRRLRGLLRPHRPATAGGVLPRSTDDQKFVIVDARHLGDWPDFPRPHDPKRLLARGCSQSIRRWVAQRPAGDLQYHSMPSGRRNMTGLRLRPFSGVKRPVLRFSNGSEAAKETPGPESPARPPKAVVDHTMACSPHAPTFPRGSCEGDVTRAFARCLSRVGNSRFGGIADVVALRLARPEPEPSRRRPAVSRPLADEK